MKYRYLSFQVEQLQNTLYRAFNNVRDDDLRKQVSNSFNKYVGISQKSKYLKIYLQILLTF